MTKITKKYVSCLNTALDSLKAGNTFTAIYTIKYCAVKHNIKLQDQIEFMHHNPQLMHCNYLVKAIATSANYVPEDLQVLTNCLKLAGEATAA